MIYIPLPFVVALLLAILLIRMVRQGDAGPVDRRRFLLLIAGYTLQSVLIGLRWGYGVTELVVLQATSATLIPALAWLAFQQLSRENAPTLARSWPHLLPAVLVGAFMALREPVDLAIILTFLGYGGALLWIARHGPDALVASRLDGALLSYRSLLITALALILSGLSDVVISFDALRYGGVHVGAIVAVGNVIALLVLGGAAAIASGSQLSEGAALEAAPPPQPTDEDGAVAATLDGLMQSRQLYRDPELNLGRIARKMNLPARRVSIAVNRIKGMSVSQYVNDFRIRAACEQLLATPDPVTQVMFDSGFISKSNFNREFSRLTGTSPTEFRKSNARLENVSTMDGKAFSVTATM
ncbi:MAG: helix-turn-helix transcriptional regulator [Rhizobiaceae bacterium]|nr:helix-turn-helix transcriptional regulator [Rhizobiaceae bacterium]